MTIKKQQKRNSTVREVLEWVISLAVAVALALAVHTWVGQLITVSGPSMQNGLWTGERVVVGKVEYYFRKPRLGDIVVVMYPNSSVNYIKRIIGTGGDTLRISGGKVFINGKVLNEPYIPEPMQQDMEETTVAADTVFVMGDNRNNSSDSRERGLVPVSRIVGRVYSILWPVEKWRKLTAYDGTLGN